MAAVVLVVTSLGKSAAAQLAPAPAPETTVAPAPAAARQLSLAQVEKAALAQQPSVLQAKALTAAAEARAREVRAPLLPQIVGTAQYLRETGNYVARPGVGPTTAAQPQSSLTNSFNYWSFGLTANQLIFDFGQTWGRWRAAQATTDAQAAAEQALRLETLFNVRRAYFNARADKELVDVARHTLADERRHLAQIEGFVTVGTRPEIDLAQARTVVANAQVALINVENGYQTAKAQLNQAAGLFQDTDYDVGDEEAAPVADEDASLAVLAQRALSSRPELAQLDKQRTAQEKTVSALKGAYGPSLSAVAGYTETGIALDGLVPNWDVGLLVSWPIFQGGLTRAQVDEAEANLQSVEQQKIAEVLQIRLDVEQARLALRAAKASLSATEEAVTSAKEQLRLADARYTTGIGSIIELTDAQLAYANAAAQSVQARYGLAIARVQLLNALGRS